MDSNQQQIADLTVFDNTPAIIINDSYKNIITISSEEGAFGLMIYDNESKLHAAFGVKENGDSTVEVYAEKAVLKLE